MQRIGHPSIREVLQETAPSLTCSGQDQVIAGMKNFFKNPFPFIAQSEDYHSFQGAAILLEQICGVPVSFYEGLEGLDFDPQSGCHQALFVITDEVPRVTNYNYGCFKRIKV